jgi:hypothetical protein
LIATTSAPFSRQCAATFRLYPLNIADDQPGLLRCEAGDDRFANTLSRAGEQHDFVFQALALRRFGNRWQGKRFSHGSRLLFESTTKTGHPWMSGQKALRQEQARKNVSALKRSEALTPHGKTVEYRCITSPVLFFLSVSACNW